MRITRKTGIIIGASVAAAAVVAGCASPQLDDLRNVGTTYPNYSVTILEPSGFPNIELTCYGGVAFALTTRDYDSLTRVPSWDAFCKTQEGKQTT